MSRLTPLPLASLLLLTLAACSDSTPAPTTTATVETTSTIEATSTPPPAETATPAPTAPAVGTPIIEAPDPERDPYSLEGVTLIEVASATARELYRGTTWHPFPLWFEPDGSLWLYLDSFEGGTTSYLYQRFDLAGRVVDERHDRPDRPSTAERDCTVPPAALEVDVPNAAFGVRTAGTSNDCTKVLLRAYVEDPGTTGAREAFWLLDIAGGNLALLTDQIRSCGGCDLVAFGGLSPSGRYLLTGETYSGPDGGRVFLIDFDAGTARLVTDRATSGHQTIQAGFDPTWRPAAAEDAMLYPAPETQGGGSILEALPSGETVALPELQWPARFDASGRYVYSAAEGVTVIAEAATGTVIERWDGVPATRWWEGAGTEPETIVATAGGPAAILAPLAGNEPGLTIHHPALPGGTIRIEAAARGAVWSPDATVVALAVRGATSPEVTWNIAVLDTISGDIRMLTTLRPYQGTPPKITWNEAGTHLLVQWPGPSGI